MSPRTLKLALLLAYLATSYHAIGGRLASLDGLVPLIVFAGLYTMLVGAMVCSAFAGRAWIRLPLALAFTSAAIVQQAFEWTTAGPLSYEAFVNLSNATGQTDAALAQHGHVLGQAALAGLLLFTAIAWPPRQFAIAHRWSISAPIIALSILTTLLFLRGGEGSRGLPSAYPPLSYSLFLLAQEVTKDRSPRETVQLARRTAAQTEDIVLLVDESIAGNYLDLNNAQGVRSGLLDKRDGVQVSNFGYATSINKCSANSNAVLRFGGTQANFQQALAHWPSIWNYAHSAGMRTVYIDAQSTGGQLQNMMTPAERREVDEFVQFDDTPVLMRDMAIADRLAAHLNNGRREFIYVNKVGAHFPVADKYPPAFERFKPTLPHTSGNPMITWTSNRAGFRGTDREWVQYRNSYRNTLTWNVGQFFDRLFAAARPGRSILIYTSDHGQDLHERHNPGNNTHCGSQNAAQEEGLVPLAIIQSPDAAARLQVPDWSVHLAENRNLANDFRIFPTLLVLMGYDRTALRQRYGTPLDEVGHDDFAYNLDFSEPLLGRNASFRKVDVSKVVTPPRSDFTEPPQP